MARVKFLVSVTLGGGTINAGTIDEVNDESAKALVRDGAAEIIEPTAEEDEDIEIPDLAAKEQVKADVATANTEAPTNSEEMVIKALDAQYKKEEIAAAAKGLGIEFPFDAKKADIIAAVIAADKATALMK